MPEATPHAAKAGARLAAAPDASATIARPSTETVEGAGRSAALPFAFNGTIGLFQPERAGVAKRQAAVLFLNPWGLEEMCSRKFFRITAERFADIGVPSLRFDYPSTGDALDVDHAPDGIASWERSVIEAAERLKSLSGCDRIILVAQGLGAMLAQRVGSRVEGVDAIVMLGPVLNGRAYLRELSVWSQFINHHLGVSDDHAPQGKATIAGLVMPAEIAVELAKLKIATPEATAAARYLILERPARSDDTTFADSLRALGAFVEQQAFEGYDALVTDPLFSTMPMETVSFLAEWMDANTSAAPNVVRSASSVISEPLAGDGFEELPVRFGEYNHLVGVVCRPLGEPTGNSVLFLATAYDRHCGWGRAIVEMARNLAREGIASLRFDSANAGDSPPRPGAPEQILYSPAQYEDARCAIDLLERFARRPIMVAGRCSGGYLAFRAVVADERLRAAVSINPFVYYWDPKQAVEKKHIVSVPRSIEDYGQRLANVDTFKRLLRGDVDVKAAARNVVIAVGRRISVRIAPLLDHLPGRRHTTVEVKRSFSALEKRKVPLTLIYSEGDVGLEHMYFQFGPGGRRLARYPNVRLVMLGDADHNLTPPGSRKTVFDEIVRLARS